MKYYDKLIFELSKEGRVGYSLGKNEWTSTTDEIPAGLRRSEAVGLPQVSEVDVVRHYTNLSQMNFGVDTGFYPLGSCTMKYNPKINEEIAGMKGFLGCTRSSRHPRYRELWRSTTTWTRPFPLSRAWPASRLILAPEPMVS